MSGRGAGSFPHEVGERNIQGSGDEEQVAVLGVTDAALVPLNGAALDAHDAREIVLREAGRAAGGVNALA